MRLRPYLIASLLPILILSAGCDSAETTTTPATTPAPAVAPPPPPAGGKAVAPGAPTDAKAKPIE